MTGVENDVTGAYRRAVVRQSALLNLVIVLTSFPALVLAEGSLAVIPAGTVMVGITTLIWIVTFFFVLNRFRWPYPVGGAVGAITEQAVEFNQAVGHHESLAGCAGLTGIRTGRR